MVRHCGNTSCARSSAGLLLPAWSTEFPPPPMGVWLAPESSSPGSRTGSKSAKESTRTMPMEPNFLDISDCAVMY